MPKLSLAKLERHLYSAADRLRQEGLDAATYKDFIFGMLFLKRCSDVFDAERERIVGRKVEQGMIKEVAETQYGENSDFYEDFFVPERARWSYLQSRLSDASEPYGSVLSSSNSSRRTCRLASMPPWPRSDRSWYGSSRSGGTSTALPLPPCAASGPWRLILGG